MFVGPDPPELNVDPFLVANEDGPIQTLCTINGEARMGSQIVWKDQNVSTVINTNEVRIATLTPPPSTGHRCFS